MIKALRQWWLWRRRLRGLEQDQAVAYRAWRRADVIYRATSVIYQDRTADGTWWRETAKAQDAVMEAFDRFRAIRSQIEDHKDMQ